MAEFDLGKKIEDFVDEIDELWMDSPLDCDETQSIADFVRNILDEKNGNMTPDETVEERRDIEDKLSDVLAGRR